MGDGSLFEFFWKYGSYILWFDDKPDEFSQIKTSLAKHHIPICIFQDLPHDLEDSDLVGFCKNASVLLLDYSFSGTGIPSLGSIGLSEKQKNDNECIKSLINLFCENSFSPVFILTNDPKRANESILADINERFSKQVFVFGKNDISDDFVETVRAKILKQFADTQKEADAFYAWSKSIEEAKFKVFKDLFYNNPDWIVSIYKEAKDGHDGISAEEHDYNFSAFLNQNLLSRYRFPSFAALSSDAPKDPKREEVVRMFQSLRTEKNEKTGDCISFWRCGDVFQLSFSDLKSFREDLKLTTLCNKLGIKVAKEEDNPEFYVINICAPCSMARGNTSGTFLIGAKCPLPSFKNLKEREKGYSSEISSVSRAKFIGFLEEECVCVCYQFVLHIDANSIKQHYKGRLLDPYLSQLRNNFTSYLNRIGVLCEALGMYACETNSGQ